jgi:hypothetical protein
MVGWPRNHAGVREVTYDNSKSLVLSSSTAKLLRSLKRIDRPLTQVQAGGSHKLSKFVLQPAPGTKSISAFQRFLAIVLRSIGGLPSGICPGTMGRMESNRRIWAVCGASYGSGTM